MKKLIKNLFPLILISASACPLYETPEAEEGNKPVMHEEKKGTPSNDKSADEEDQRPTKDVTSRHGVGGLLRKRLQKK